ncbi:hypothetical protein AAG906_006781 [Vitis piasezkii]
MTWFLQSIDLDLWDVIENGPTFPLKLVDGVMVLKTKQEWDECEKRNFQLNAKVVYTLQCVMDRNEYNRICHLGKELQGIRESDEDFEVTSIKVRSKGPTIQEAKDLTKLPLEGLIKSLMTYEINLEKMQQEGEDKKKKNITLKATTKEEEEVEEEKQSEEDEDLALIKRNFNKFMRGEKFRGRRFTFRRDSFKKESSSHGDKERL